MKELFYEVRPYLYVALGCYTLAHFDYNLTRFCALTLFACGTLIIHWRLSHRGVLAKK